MIDVFRALSVFNTTEDGSQSLINVCMYHSRHGGRSKNFGVAVVILLVLIALVGKGLPDLPKGTPATPGSAGSELWLKRYIICIRRRSLSQDKPLQNALKLSECNLVMSACETS